ncbi:hypothetical protein Q5752_000511 [Cryptotrichosporon argae]
MASPLPPLDKLDALMAHARAQLDTLVKLETRPTSPPSTDTSPSAKPPSSSHQHDTLKSLSSTLVELMLESRARLPGMAEAQDKAIASLRASQPGAHWSAAKAADTVPPASPPNAVSPLDADRLNAEAAVLRPLTTLGTPPRRPSGSKRFALERPSSPTVAETGLLLSPLGHAGPVSGQLERRVRLDSRSDSALEDDDDERTTDADGGSLNPSPIRRRASRTPYATRSLSRSVSRSSTAGSPLRVSSPSDTGDFFTEPVPVWDMLPAKTPIDTAKLNHEPVMITSPGSQRIRQLSSSSNELLMSLERASPPTIAETGMPVYSPDGPGPVSGQLERRPPRTSIDTSNTDGIDGSTKPTFIKMPSTPRSQRRLSSMSDYRPEPSSPLASPRVILTPLPRSPILRPVTSQSLRSTGSFRSSPHTPKRASSPLPPPLIPHDSPLLRTLSAVPAPMAAAPASPPSPISISQLNQAPVVIALPETPLARHSSRPRVLSTSLPAAVVELASPYTGLADSPRLEEPPEPIVADTGKPILGTGGPKQGQLRRVTDPGTAAAVSPLARSPTTAPPPIDPLKLNHSPTVIPLIEAAIQRSRSRGLSFSAADTSPSQAVSDTDTPGSTLDEAASPELFTPAATAEDVPATPPEPTVADTGIPIVGTGGPREGQLRRASRAEGARVVKLSTLGGEAVGQM